MFSASDLKAEVGTCWLQYAKLCRAAGHYETANRAILQAQSVRAPNAHIEMAKLFWDTEKSHRAIAELQQALAHVPAAVRVGEELLVSNPMLGIQTVFLYRKLFHVVEEGCVS